MNEQLVKLIAEASAIAGNDHKLSKLLNVAQPAIVMWKSGSRPCPPEEVASIAYVAGYDPVAWYVRATLWKFAGTPKGEKLAKVLGKALPRTGGASDLPLSVDVANSSTSSSTRVREKVHQNNTMYSMVKLKAALSGFFYGLSATNMVANLSWE
jgi:hypothetical protein